MLHLLWIRAHHRSFSGWMICWMVPAVADAGGKNGVKNCLRVVV
jgi:hypothetical protein